MSWRTGLSSAPAIVAILHRIDPRDAIVGVALKILAQATAVVEPRNRALGQWAARLHLEANLVGRACGNLDRDTEHLRGPFDQIATVALIRPGIARR